MTLLVLTETFNAERLSRELLAQVHARGAQIAYDAIQRKANLGDTDVRIEVDGKASRQIDAWQKRIRLSWANQGQLGQLLTFVWRQIARRSPVLTGGLLGAYVWQLNGRTVGFGAEDGETLARQIGGLKRGDELRLVNMKPYIRKAEHGQGRGRSAIKVGKHRIDIGGLSGKKVIFEPTAAAAQRRFRGFYIADSWIEISGHVISRGIRANRQHSKKPDQRIPTILIRVSNRTTSFGASNG